MKSSSRFGSERAYLAEALLSPFGRQLIVPVLFAAVIFSTGLLFSSAAYNPINPQVMDLSSGAMAIAVFALAKLFGFSGRFANLAIWFTAGALASAIPNLEVFLINGKFDDGLLLQLPIGVIAYSTNIASLALLWSGFRLGRQRAARLRLNLESLEQDQLSLESQITQMRGEIVSEVRKELTEVSNLLAKADSLNRNDMAEKIMSAIDSVIRPLSHRLAGFGLDLSETVTHVPSELQPSKPGVAWSRLAGPEIFLAAFMLFIVPATFIVGGVSNGILVILVALGETFVLVLVERFAVRFVVNRVIGLLLNLTLSSAFGAGFLMLSSGDSMLGVAIGFFTISLVCTTLLALVSKRIDTLNNLEFVRAQKTNLVVRLGQEVWVTKSRLAKAIHGSVQAKFLAIALKLKNSGSEATLGEAKQDVLEATAAIDASLESNQQSLEAQLNAYREAWAGALDLEFKILPEAAAQLDSDPIARACVAEVIGEAIANAAKHSQAKNVQIDLISEPGLVRVSVGSQGAIALTDSNSGYGSLILDQVSNSWVLRESDGKVILEATFLLAK